MSSASSRVAPQARAWSIRLGVSSRVRRRRLRARHQYRSYIDQFSQGHMTLALCCSGTVTRCGHRPPSEIAAAYSNAKLGGAFASAHRCG